MVAYADPRRMTVAEYLDFERTSETRNEYYDGVIYGLAGSSPNHNLISVDTGAFLSKPLHKKGCTVYALDVRVQLSFSKYAYPDVVVVCGEQEMTDEDPPSILNPVLIIEVLSNSTESFDRTTKFDHYASRPSLVEYVLISQTIPRVERYFRRSPSLWDFEVFSGLDAVVRLRSVDFDLPLAEIYARVEFEAEE